MIFTFVAHNKKIKPLPMLNLLNGVDFPSKQASLCGTKPLQNPVVAQIKRCYAHNVVQG